MKQELADHAKKFRDDIAENLGQARTDIQRQVIGRLKYPLDVYVKAAEKMVDLVAQNPDEAAKAMPEFLKKFEALEVGMGDASKEFENEQTAIAERGNQAKQSAILYLAGLLAAGLVAAGVIALLVRVSLVRPLLNMTAAMKKLAGGDVSVEVPSTGRKDEIGAMAAALLAFKEGLGERQRLEAEAAVVHDENAQELRRTEEAFRVGRTRADCDRQPVGGGARRAALRRLSPHQRAGVAPTISASRTTSTAPSAGWRTPCRRSQPTSVASAPARGEISHGADDLSRRTEQQAASLEETAAALDEITATVKPHRRGRQPGPRGRWPPPRTTPNAPARSSARPSPPWARSRSRPSRSARSSA